MNYKKNHFVQGLKRARDKGILNQQEYRTLRGKVLKGEYEEMRKGFRRIMKRKFKEDPSFYMESMSL